MRSTLIGDLVEPIQKWNPRVEGKGEISYIDISSVDRHTHSIIAAKTIQASEAPSRARQIVTNGDVLVSTVSPSSNTVAYVHSCFDGATASTGFCVLRPQPYALHSRYLYHWVKTNSFVRYLTKFERGAIFPAVSDQVVKATPIPTPTIEEQRRIAAVLDAAEALRAKCRQALAKLESLTQVVFNDMFGRDVSDKRWVTTKLGDISEVISGATPKTSEKSYWDGDIYWATPKDLSDLNGPYINTTSRTISAEGIQSCSASLLPVHSVLLSSRAPIGYVAINKVPIATNQGFKSFVPDRTYVDSRFLYEYLRQYRPQLESLGSGATFKEVSKRVIEKIEISLPPLQLQEQFGNALDAVETMRIKLSEALVGLDALFASLQQRAFRGEL